MRITKYTVTVNGKVVSYVNSLEKCVKELEKYPPAQIVTVIDDKSINAEYVIGPYLA